jgi:hypothetical protein
MAWGEVEVTDEGREWLLGLPEKEYARAMAYIDLLAERADEAMARHRAAEVEERP